ncbi:MAG TPA: hypothetical protein VFG78_09205 [Gemmatimonadota bacterium]|nr:hypothetical protein [Gemmatimonadota bacterium]
MKRGPLVLGLTALTLFAASAPASAQAPFKEGPVVQVSYVRTEPGQFDNYMRYIFGDYARLQNALKEAGIIVDWGVFATDTRSPDEANLVLTTTYANMAALDDLDARMDPIVQEVLGRDRAESAEAGVQRGPMRQLIGTQLYRQLGPPE